MGDRVLMQVVSGSDFGPVVYGHWAGGDASAIVRRLAERMKDRPDDLDYSSARLVQELIGDRKGAISFGVSNAKARLTAEDSHGDAGVILIDCANGHKCECFGGYLKTGPDGLPVETN